MGGLATCSAAPCRVVPVGGQWLFFALFLCVLPPSPTGSPLPSTARVAALAATAAALLCVSTVSADNNLLALQALYKATGGDSWAGNTNWLSASVSYCSWYGIVCNGAGDPMNIVLRGNNLAGQIPEEIGMLNNSLVILDLGENSLKGPIPQSLTSMTVLQELFFDVNNLSGGLPANLANLFAVKSLNVSNNALTGGIPTSIKYMTITQYVDMSHNQLSGPIPAEVQFMAALQSIDLSYNALSGFVPPAAYDRLDATTLCRLNNNNLACPEPSYIVQHCGVAC